MAKVKMLRSGSDKSISHRAAMISAIALKPVIVKNYLFASDTLNTLKALGSLGVDIETRGLDVRINGKGKHSLTEPVDVLDMGNSGTGIRLLSGILSGCDFFSVLTGDDSLKKRPMMRIITPLSEMGATIIYRDGGYAPLAIKGSYPLKGIKYTSPVASAQVKSSILLAGLFANGDVSVDEPVKSRDHTERMLKFMGVDVEAEENRVMLGENRTPIGDCEIYVPADISSSAFFMVFALLREGAEIVLKDVCLNETRDGILRVFDQCEASYEIVDRRIRNNEPVGDVVLRYTRNLKPFKIDKTLLPSLIDEIPILSILAIFCDGVSVVSDASELRKKESDRIKAICSNLERVGVKAEETEDGFKVYGTPEAKVQPASIETFNDHRIAMSFAILEAVTSAGISLSETRSIRTSYPAFFDHLNYLLG